MDNITQLLEQTYYLSLSHLEDILGYREYGNELQFFHPTLERYVQIIGYKDSYVHCQLPDNHKKTFTFPWEDVPQYIVILIAQYDLNQN